MKLAAWRTSRYGLGLTILLSVIAGCGGGGGGGRSTSPSLVGTYVGTADTTLTSPRGSVPVRGGIQFVVSPDHTVSVGDPGQPPIGTGPLDGNTFVVTAPGSSLNSAGVSCGGAMLFSGAISGATMSGDVSSSDLRCNGVPFNLTGTFTATLRAELKGGTGRGLIQSVTDRVGAN